MSFPSEWTSGQPQSLFFSYWSDPGVFFVFALWRALIVIDVRAVWDPGGFFPPAGWEGTSSSVARRGPNEAETVSGPWAWGSLIENSGNSFVCEPHPPLSLASTPWEPPE